MTSKYRAIPAVIDGIRFDSRGEAARYLELKFMVQQGAIKNLRLQPKFDFHMNGEKICYYKADFQYEDGLGNEIVEDFKGAKTPMYNLKKKMFKIVYKQYKFVETTARDLKKEYKDKVAAI